ncbi:hypothetical protein [Bradyrhizobium sp. CCBAU 51753]|uniref:hypothetical protein n=1 Tax=Bradyrhizobium sp. CCBAU 51753 TaxID=1325100 RepID=UPI00188ADE07|nr:hypothetical protein [Bradyrhizobium sp. CCBAU 51753]QOZ26689.1 hypothetical protein XH93_26060 [Bradyrhizobium sp. CCBAU 51753]
MSEPHFEQALLPSGWSRDVRVSTVGDGIFDAPSYRGSGDQFGVGSDSKVLIGVADELRQLKYSQRLVQRARNVMATPQATSTARALFDGALAAGEQALGDGGGIAPGLAADIVSLDAESLALAGRSGDAILDSWIPGNARRLVDCVWTSGRKVVTRGRHHQAESVAAVFRRRLEGLRTE